METCFKILQLKFDKKLTNRCIGLTLHISASTVFEVLARFKASSLSWPLPADISHDTLEKLIFPPKDTFASELVMPDMLYFDTEMRKPGVTRQLLWMEYKAQAGDKAMGYSHFCRCYLLKQWEGLNVYCSNGQVEIDNNIAENALRGVAVGRKNWMFAGSDSGGEHAAVLYSLMGTCRLNNVEPEKWLRYVIEHIQDWPANRVRDLLPWKVDLTSQ
ncbi:TPA: transposase [Escherichia coli]